MAPQRIGIGLLPRLIIDKYGVLFAVDGSSSRSREIGAFVID